MFLKMTGDPDLRRILLARSLRAFGDGYVAILLPFYLIRLEFESTAVGAITTATLVGSAFATLALGRFAHFFPRRVGLIGASVLMAATGLAFAGLGSFWPLMLVAFVGTLNPSGGDVSVFLPLEHTVIAHIAPNDGRTRFFAHYAFVGALWGALGALCLGALDWLDAVVGPLAGARLLFVLYGLLGLATWRVYAGISARIEGDGADAKRPLGPSRNRIYGLAALFSVDAFAGGLIVNSLLALWLSDRFGAGPGELGAIFFATSTCSAVSYFAAAPLASRFGLLNTMVFTHIPSSVLLILTAFAPALWIAVALLMMRALLSQMDVPTRSSFVMAVVTPAERPAAASVTAVPRSLAAAAAPLLSGWLFASSAFAWPLVAAGVLKIAYDLALLGAFAKVKPSEEIEKGPTERA